MTYFRFLLPTLSFLGLALLNPSSSLNAQTLKQHVTYYPITTYKGPGCSIYAMGVPGSQEIVQSARNLPTCCQNICQAQGKMWTGQAAPVTTSFLTAPYSSDQCACL